MSSSTVSSVDRCRSLLSLVVVKSMGKHRKIVQDRPALVRVNETGLRGQSGVAPTGTWIGGAMGFSCKWRLIAVIDDIPVLEVEIRARLLSQCLQRRLRPFIMSENEYINHICATLLRCI